MMPFEVSCTNFKCYNKFLFLQYVSCFLFFPPKDILTCSCFCLFLYFSLHITFYTNMLKKKKEASEKHKKSRKKCLGWVCLYFLPCLFLESLRFLFLSFTSHLRDPSVFDNVSAQRPKPLLIATSHHPLRKG